MKNSTVNVLEGIAVGADEPGLLAQFLDTHDFAAGTRRLVTFDVRQFAKWFVEANREPFVVSRVTMRDVVDFRDCLRRERQQAVATVNRSLVLIRRFFAWLTEQGRIPANPAKQVKELRRVPLAPKGLERAEMRRLLREVEVRHDVRANAIFSLMAYSGARVSDVVNLELHDVLLGERSGSAVFRFGKGGKQRTVQLTLPARRALQAYLDTRPPVASTRVFVGERGALSESGVRALCDKYAAICGFKLHPHKLRHTFSHRFLADNNNDLVSLAQVLGHSDIRVTARYCQRTQEQLGDASERVNY